MKKNHLLFSVFPVLLFLTNAVVPASHQPAKMPVTDSGWCSHPLRQGLKLLKEIKTSRPWFKVYDVGAHVYAIDEPYNYEETIGYLVLGSKRALLFDTGMGMNSPLHVKLKCRCGYCRRIISRWLTL